MKYGEWTKILKWPGYQVYQFEIDEERKTLKLWVRRKRGTKKLICSGCGRHCGEIHDATEREVRDLPWSEYKATVVVELHRVRCPECGLKMEKVAQLPSKAPYSKRFEEVVGQACESASARQVARRMGLAESTVRAIDLRYLERWEASRRKPPLRQMGVDELYRGKKDKFLTVVCNLETAEPLWFGRERKKETLDEFFRSQLSRRQRKRIEAVCVDMWEPFRLSIEEWAPQCKIVYDKFHILQHANDAIDEVRRAEFFRQGKQKRALIKGKKWLLMSRWTNLTAAQRGDLNRLFQLNRKVFKAYLLKESLEKLWDYRYEGAMLNYLQKWMDQLKWQRLAPFEELAHTLLKHLQGILNYCRTKVRFGVVEAVNGNIRMLINRGRGYKNLRYLLLKAKRIAVTNVEFVTVHRIKKAA
ncbi:MAG TPA: ISL3 family transposase [Terriglobales bacterium]